MKNLIAIAVILVILGLAMAYIVKQKKKGSGCIGCPSRKECSGSCNMSSKI